MVPVQASLIWLDNARFPRFSPHVCPLVGSVRPRGPRILEMSDQWCVVNGMEVARHVGHFLHPVALVGVVGVRWMNARGVEPRW